MKEYGIVNSTIIFDNNFNKQNVIIFDNNFNKQLDNYNKIIEDNNITHLILGSNFNQPIDKLPNSIKYLKLKGRFNQSIDNLPNSITHLTLEYNFNQCIDNLPLRLKEIDIKYCKFKKSIKERLLDVIPINCKIID
jgi:hypothetical protein